MAGNKYRILLIGWNVSHVQAYKRLLEKDGHFVYWVGHGAFGPNSLNMENIPGTPVNYEGPLGKVAVGQRWFKLGSLLDMLGGRKFDMDVIIHMQDWFQPTELEKSPLPYIYYSTEPFYPVVPNCAWGVLTPTESYMKFLQSKYKHRFNYCVLPWAVRVEMSCESPKLDEKTVDCCFAGKLHNYPFYEKRRDIVRAIKDAIPNFEGHWYASVPDVNRFTFGFIPEIEEGKGRLEVQEYIEMYQRSRFAINIPTPFGPNFRDFEAPACGSILLTTDTPDHRAMGFEDGVNCYFYKTVEEAIDIIKTGYDRSIAEKGWLLMQQYHGYEHRVKELVDIIEATV